MKEVVCLFGLYFPSHRNTVCERWNIKPAQDTRFSYINEDEKFVFVSFVLNPKMTNASE